MPNTFKIEIPLTKKTVFTGLTLSLLVFLGCPVNSENLTLTTYYPAPYGGYVSLLTTGNALLARDGGNVGVGVAAPSAKLDVAGAARIRTADGTRSMVYVNKNGTMMTGTETPVSPAPDGSYSNVETNDVYLRGINYWASQIGLNNMKIYSYEHLFGYTGANSVVVGCGTGQFLMASGGMAQEYEHTGLFGWGGLNPTDNYCGAAIERISASSIRLRKSWKGSKLKVWYICVPSYGIKYP